MMTAGGEAFAEVATKWSVTVERKPNLQLRAAWQFGFSK